MISCDLRHIEQPEVMNVVSRAIPLRPGWRRVQVRNEYFWGTWMRRHTIGPFR